MCRVARGASAPGPCRGRGATRPRAAGAGVCALRGRAQVATTPQRHPTGRPRGCTPPPLSSLIPTRHFCKKPTVVAASLPFFEGCKRTADPSERSQTMSTRRWVWSRCACIRFFLWESFDKARGNPRQPPGHAHSALANMAHGDSECMATASMTPTLLRCWRHRLHRSEAQLRKPRDPLGLTIWLSASARSKEGNHLLWRDPMIGGLLLPSREPELGSIAVRSRCRRNFE